MSPMASTEVNDRDLSALRVELGNRIAHAESKTRAELKPLALQVEAVTQALQSLRARANPPAAKQNESALSDAELAELKDEVESLESELAALLDRIEALERRPPIVYAGGGGAPGLAGPPGPQGPPGAPAAPTFSYMPQGW